MPPLLTILASLPAGKPQRDYLEALFALPVRPTYRNLAGLCEVVPYEHDLAWARDSTFLPKSGRKLPGSATAGMAARGGWSGASSWNSSRSWT